LSSTKEETRSFFKGPGFLCHPELPGFSNKDNNDTKSQQAIQRMSNGIMTG